MSLPVRLSVAIVLSLLLASAPALAGAEKQSPTLRNDDVIAMAKAGLSDDIIIAKIQRAQSVDFDTTTERLIRLKKSGLSNRVLDAMIRPSDQQSPASVSRAGSERDVLEKVAGNAVVLRSSDGEFILQPTLADWEAVGFVVHMMYARYPGSNAKTRIKDTKPSIFFALPLERPDRSIFLVKLEQEPKRDRRSLKFGHGVASAMMAIPGGEPDPDWTIKCDITEESRGMWRLSPNVALKPGEYGVVFQGNLFGFGVD